MEKQFIITTEFGEIFHHEGELPPDVFDAVNQGIYAAVDATDPANPKWLDPEGNWQPVRKLPS